MFIAYNINGNYTEWYDINNVKSTNNLKNTIISAMDNGKRSCVLNVVGDSTGNGTDEWVYLLANKLASQYPTHNVDYRLINSTSKKWEEVINIQSVGEERHLLCSGTGYCYNTPHSKVDYTGSDLDIRIKFQSDNVDDNAEFVFFSKFSGGGDRCWRAYKGSNNKINFDVSEDGSALISYYTSLDISSWSKTEKHFIRFVFDADNGSSQNELTIYTSDDDGQTWTSIYNSTKAGAVTLHQDTVPNFVYGAYSNSIAPFTGKLYKVEFMDGIDGQNLLPVLWEDNQQPNFTPIGQSVAGTPTLTIYNSSISGYSTSDYDLALLKRAIVVSETANVIVSLSHNQGKMINSNLYDAFDQVITDINSLTYKPSITFITQNPKGDSVDFVIEQDIRQGNICAYANDNDYGIIDTYTEFSRQFNKGVPFYDLINVDDIHPTNLGSALYRDVIYNFLR